MIKKIIHRLLYAFVILFAGQVYASDKPNIILVLLDDVSPDMFSCYAPYAPKGFSHAGYTPNIDSLASKGVMFKTCYATAMCAPSRVELMTGRYANATGVYHNSMWANERSTLYLEDFPSIGRLLKDAGYATAIAGKWHAGSIYPYEEQGGFDEYCLWSSISLMEKCDNYVGWTGGMENATTTSRYWNPGLILNDSVVYTKEDDFGPEICSRFLMDFMERSVNNGQPFFAYWPSVAPHGTRQGVTTNPFRGEVGEMGSADSEEKAARFKSLNEYIDFLIGRMSQKLTELGIEDNTLFIITSDNGTAVTAKTRGIERGCHVVNVIAGYNVVQRGATDELTDFTDIAPTLVEVSGAQLPEGYSFDGESLYPFLSGNRDTHREWIYGYISTSQLFRTRDYLVEVLNPMLGLPEGRFCYTGPYRFREGYVRAENIPEHLDGQRELLEIAKKFPPVESDHPYWVTDRGSAFYEDYTSESSIEKHLHNQSVWVYYNEDKTTNNYSKVTFRVAGKGAILENAKVEMGKQSSLTGDEGTASFYALKLDSAIQYRVSKAGFEAIVDTIRIFRDTVVAIDLTEYVGISHEAANSLIKLYPVPAKEKLFIDCAHTNAAFIRIMDLSGRVIHEQAVRGNTEEVDVSNYRSGIYVLELYGINKQSRIAKEFIILK